jgi:hypothetical protein
MTPGQHQTHDLAGALELTTGTLPHRVGPRNTNARFRDLLGRLEVNDPADRYPRVDVVVDHETIHQAKAVEPGLVAHPRVRLLFLPTYGPRANPIARACGDVHDGCTRNHRRLRFPDLIAAVEDHWQVNGPWQYKRSDLYDEPAVTAAVEHIAADEQTTVAA